MDYSIIELPKGSSEMIGKLVQDDLISRQTIVIRDRGSLELEGEGSIVMIEGSTEALSKAADMVGASGNVLQGDEMSSLYKKIKESEDNAASGLGLMFG